MLFRSINDACGHLAGDETIVRVANIMTRYLPQQAQAIRFGGDEFMVVLPKHTAQQATEYAEKVRSWVRTEPCCSASNTPVTMSFGVTQMKPDETLHDVISRSDHALYRSKENGRDRVTVLSEQGKELTFSSFKESA